MMSSENPSENSYLSPESGISCKIPSGVKVTAGRTSPSMQTSQHMHLDFQRIEGIKVIEPEIKV